MLPGFIPSWVKHAPGTPPATGETPDAIFGADLAAWWRADTGVYEDVAGTVPAGWSTYARRWNDKSGNGANLITGGGDLMFFKTTIEEPYLGHPSVTQLGGIAWMDTADNAVQFHNTKVSAFMVCWPYSAPNYGRNLAFTTGSLYTHADYDNAVSANLLLNGIGGGSGGLAGYINNTEFGWQTMTFATRCRFGAVINGTQARTYLNNVGGPTTTIPMPNFGPTGAVRLGAATGYPIGTAGGPYNASRLEVVLVKNAATTDQMNALDAYFVGRYGA